MYTGHLPAVSNRETWRFEADLSDPDIGDAIDLTGATITLAVREQDGNIPAIQQTSSGSNITIASPATNGIFTVSFSPAEMAVLAAGSYEVGITVLLASGYTYQLLVATMPVVDGVVQ